MKLLLFMFLTFAATKTENRKGFLYIDNEMLKIEVAETADQITRGLMYRTEIPDDYGMLFIFKDERVRSFWMKNTFVDLSIGFFDKSKKLIDIQDMKAVKSEMEMNLPRYQSREPAQYALEVKKGWFERKKIKLGASFKIYKNKKP